MFKVLTTVQYNYVKYEHFADVLTAVARYSESEEKTIIWMLSLVQPKDSGESLWIALALSIWTDPVLKPTAR